MKSKIILLMIVVAAVAVVLSYYWSAVNSSRVKKRGPPNKVRRGDRVPLRGSQKKIYNQARQMLNGGNAKGAAQLFESIGLTREAVSVLEQRGYIDEAAAILHRIGRPNRAGVIYSRHGLWKKAASSFKKANMPEEVAKCEREAGDYVAAAKYFLLASQKSHAAECFLDVGDHRRAAKLYLELGDIDKAIELYEHLMDTLPSVNQIELEESEVKLIYNNVINGNYSPKFADLLVAQNKAVDAILELIKRGEVKNASEVYLRCTTDIGPELISKEGLTEKDNIKIGDLFMIVANYEYAGMIYERLGQFAQAGAAFEKAEDYGRSLYCFDRIGMKEKAQEIRFKIAEVGDKHQRIKNVPPKEVPGNPFTISEESGAQKMPTMPPLPVFNIGVENDVDDGVVDYSANEESTKIVREGEIPKSETPSELTETTSDDTPEEIATVEVKTIEEPSHRQSPRIDPHRAAFHQSEFLEGLSLTEKRLIEKNGHIKSFAAGDVILDFNDEPEGLYFILSGKVACFRSVKDQEDTLVDRMTSPATFGEFWLLVDLPTRVKFVATEDVQIQIVDRGRFLELLDQNGSIARKVYKRFTQKLLSKLINRENPQQNQMAS